jgi:hypothetical protein
MQPTQSSVTRDRSRTSNSPNDPDTSTTFDGHAVERDVALCELPAVGHERHVRGLGERGGGLGVAHDDDAVARLPRDGAGDGLRFEPGVPGVE